MKIQSVKAVYFSPTGTTKTVLKGIVEGINCENIEYIDITNPRAREKALHTKENELLIAGVPVYMGRVPEVIGKWLNTIQASSTPTVSLVVYGNRVYDNALLELTDILEKQGCIPIAGAAFIGEHSFHSPELPAASEGRPDKNDLIQAKFLGKEINKKLHQFSSVKVASTPEIPGCYPYGGVTKMWDVDFIEVSDECLNCGLCSRKCPTGAIDKENSSSINIEKCTLCCACIKSCPVKARSMKPGLMKDAAKRVHELFIDRKEPELFI